MALIRRRLLKVGVSYFKKVYSKESRASAFCEILNKIKSLTFVVYDGNTLEQLIDIMMVEQLLDIIKTYKDQIPLGKSKKYHLTGRVGMAVEQQRLSRTIDVQPKTEEIKRHSKFRKR